MEVRELKYINRKNPTYGRRALLYVLAFYSIDKRKVT